MGLVFPSSGQICPSLALIQRITINFLFQSDDDNDDDDGANVNPPTDNAANGDNVCGGDDDNDSDEPPAEEPLLHSRQESQSSTRCQCHKTFLSVIY
jgi:hypothetical protein